MLLYPESLLQMNNWTEHVDQRFNTSSSKTKSVLLQINIKFWELCLRRQICPKKQKDSKKRYSTNFRNSRLEVFCKKRAFKNLLESFFKKSCRLEGCNFIKKGLQHRCFPVNFAKSFKNLFCRTSANRIFWNFLLKHNVAKKQKYKI